MSCTRASTPIPPVGPPPFLSASTGSDEAVHAVDGASADAASRMRAVALAGARMVMAETVNDVVVVVREAASQVMPIDDLAIGLYDPLAEALCFSEGYDAGVLVPALCVHIAGTPSERVIRTRRTLVTLRSDDPAAQGAHIVGTGRRSESIIRTPILTDDRVLGLLIAQSYTSGQYAANDVELLETLAAVAASALLNVEALRARDEALVALAERDAQLQQAQKLESVGQLAGGIAHDFNNLLMVISGSLHFALEDIDPSSPFRQDLDAAAEAAARAAQLTRQLLAFSRKQLLRPEILNLGQVVEAVAPMLQRMIGEDNIIEVRLDPDLPRIAADPGQLEQVLLSLAVNSRDAMPGGGKLIITTQLAAMQDGRAAVRLSVTDTGCGMDARTAQHAFEPFFTTKGLGKGTGLGLSTVHGIVKQSGGTIDVTSVLGEGTTFDIRFPVPSEDFASAGPRQDDAPGAGSRRAGTVLLVEDEHGVRQVVHRQLVDAGYTVLAAAGADEALAIAVRTTHIDVLLTDVVMPGLNGRELSARFSGLFPRAQVVFMSGYTDDEILRRGLHSAEAVLVSKPFSRETLLATLDKVLRP